MQRARRRHVPGKLGFAGAVGALLSVSMLSGCPGTLDPNVNMTGGSNGAGGSTATGGSTGAGGSTATGGSAAAGGATGTGGTSSGNCTGGNDGATLVTNTCAVTYCHDPGGASSCGGLDLTIDSGISGRLVGVTSVGTSANGSFCMSEAEPYLVAGSNPATGLLIDKTKASPPCGNRMPYVGTALTTAQETCLVQWATTLTSP